MEIRYSHLNRNINIHLGKIHPRSRPLSRPHFECRHEKQAKLRKANNTPNALLGEQRNQCDAFDKSRKNKRNNDNGCLRGGVSPGSLSCLRADEADAQSGTESGKTISEAAFEGAERHEVHEVFNNHGFSGSV